MKGRALFHSPPANNNLTSKLTIFRIYINASKRLWNLPYLKWTYPFLTHIVMNSWLFGKTEEIYLWLARSDRWVRCEVFIDLAGVKAVIWIAKPTLPPRDLKHFFLFWSRCNYSKKYVQFFILFFEAGGDFKNMVIFCLIFQAVFIFSKKICIILLITFHNWATKIVLK